MVEVSLANGNDLQHIARFGQDFQRKTELKSDIPCDINHFFDWLMTCYQSYGVYVFVAKENENVTGFLVLDESPCAWNANYMIATDVLFVAEKGGLKLIRAARKLKEAKGWYKLILSTSASYDRSDKLYEHLGTRIGGVYTL